MPLQIPPSVIWKLRERGIDVEEQLVITVSDPLPDPLPLAALPAVDPLAAGDELEPCGTMLDPPPAGDILAAGDELAEAAAGDELAELLAIDGGITEAALVRLVEETPEDPPEAAEPEGKT